MEVFSLQQRAAKTPEEALHKQYRFWYTQPVPKMTETILNDGPIEEDKTVDQIRNEPFTLPDGFQWDTLNLDDPFVLKELYTLLNENYVEDEDSMFRFDYQPHFLKWALQPPGWLKEWHVGVRVIKSNKLVGFISAIPALLKVYNKSQKMVEINFLCVHKRLRSKRVAPVLIREITRRVNQKGIFQAVYTAGIVLPKPIGTCRYWHRSLNPKKLIDVKFSHLSRNMTMQRTLKLHKLPDSTRTPGFRKLTEKDLPQARKLLSSVRIEYTNIKMNYDLVSFYTLPSTIMHHPTYRTLKAAYSFYNVSTKTPWIELMQDALISARDANFDVFNALDLMDNKEFLEPLKFGVGDGNLQYYLYNWKCPEINSNKIGLILQ
ncbi:PREDICTED: glycylpeptide N-tetradecanoyltransferase 1 [Diuraphis noxia]|uniref:glycylpeptide N-tetradecanoyltransferase 1 n=1 Tax=Diuraphis noxia TaxID=143948 RepID=UPI000763B048|nr:PREDICTED: glycylpeptide N-tetradecanoyltransferase 1 [Diuraphis noxia]